MGWLILLIFVGVPLVELSILIEVGEDIGVLSTIALCLITAGGGLSLIRMQGLKVVADIQQASTTGEPMGKHLIHGFFLLIAGVLLFFPGFMTDTLGALLLIPPVRLLLGHAGLARAAARGTTGFYQRQQSSNDNTYTETTTIVEGEYWHAETPSSDVIDQTPSNDDPTQTDKEDSKTDP